MPGDLAAPHADLEADCQQCHQPFDTGAEDAAYLVCHDTVDADVARGTGYHGIDPRVAAQDCRSCHPDHRGRELDLVGLDPATFDHALTDMPLRGAHRALACASCHEPDAKHREATNDCIGCHREADAHGGALGEDCASCHEPSSWQSTQFDHDTTRYPLVGAHASADCGLCHSGGRYRDTPTDCATCHRLDDAHEGRFGSDCASCHDPRGWKRGDFDHAATGFALEGRHARASCESCHVEPPDTVDLPQDCHSCHRLDDTHRGARGEDCGGCHTSADWTHSRFDHEAASDFALVEAHARLDCRACHPVAVDQPIEDKSCGGCHARDDVHEGELSRQCSDCHGQVRWSAPIRFDHDLARFPLLGLHAALTCEECHTDARFVGTVTDCVDCHRGGDVHGARLGPRCADCHTPNGWGVWSFDHDTKTAFALHGQHEGLACTSCHRQPTTGAVRASSDCSACHARDDAHRGSFGRSCGSCHTPRGWEHATLPGLRGGSTR
jgi:hypothetical protein